MPFVRSTDGVRIHYSAFGPRDGIPVVLIQGLGADSTLWALQRVALSRRFRVVCPDNRGVGRSDKPQGAYTIDQMASDVLAAMDDAGIVSAHIVGASMGGIIAQLIAVHHPDRVRSLVLSCTACHHHQWRIDLLKRWKATALSSGMRAMTNEAARWMIGPRSFRRISPAVGLLGPLAFSSPAAGFAAQVDAIVNMDDRIADRLSEIDAPVLVMVGTQDILTPRADAEQLVERIPTAELCLISGAAHGVMIEHAVTFNRVLIEFIDRSERGLQSLTGPGVVIDMVTTVS